MMKIKYIFSNKYIGNKEIRNLPDRSNVGKVFCSVKTAIVYTWKGNMFEYYFESMVIAYNITRRRYLLPFPDAYGKLKHNRESLSCNVILEFIVSERNV